MKNCLICKRIEQIKKGKNPTFVRELKTGYVVLFDYQFYPGYTLFISKRHVFELHDLQDKERELFLSEMSRVAKGIYKAFRVQKLNYALLGNKEPHLHWHIIPRYENDPNLNNPIWTEGYDQKRKKATKKELNRIKKILNIEI